MRTCQDTVGLLLLVGLWAQLGFSFEGGFTELPSNMTVKEGQNIQMACAFQSGTASVYLEIQWWFLRALESSDSQEQDMEDQEMEMIPEPDPDPDNEGTKISTVKVQGNDISHRLQISRVSKKDEGLYECRVTRANYGEIVEYKAQAWLKINATARPLWPFPPAKKSSPLHLTDKKPRKSSSTLGQDNNSDQRVASTSISHTTSNTAKHSPGSGTRTSLSSGLAVPVLVCSLLKDVLL